MTRRTLIAAMVALLLLVAGFVQYRRMTAQAAAAAADCADKPKPKDEFTMAAPCDSGTEKGAATSPKPAPATPKP